MLHLARHASQLTNIAAALTGLAAAASASAQAALLTAPRVDTVVVVDAEDGTSAVGAGWRTWLVADPAGTLHVSTPLEAIGSVRAGALWAETAPHVDAPAAPDRVVVAERIEADPNAPGGRSSLVAVARTSSASRFTALPPMQLARIAAPQVMRAGSDVVVAVEPMLSLGVPVLDAQGLVGWNVLRSPEGLDDFVVVGSVLSSPSLATFRDRDVMAGGWRYAVQPVFAGELVLGLPGPFISLVSSCDEPSAIDRRPWAEPLRVRRDGANVLVTWEPTMAPRFDVMAGHLSVLRTGARDFTPAACGVSGTSASVDVGTSDALIVVAHCGFAISSQGRGSDGIERDLISSACP
jgi:hypothetical protein